MAAFLLVIIYFAFISLGLPDGSVQHGRNESRFFLWEVQVSFQWQFPVLQSCRLYSV